MKIAQALNKRKALKQEFALTVSLIQSQSQVAHGDPKPEQSVSELIAKALSLSDQYVELVKKIELANFSTQLPCGMTIAEGLVARDQAKFKVDHFSKLLTVGSREREYYDENSRRVRTTLILAIDLGEVRRMVNQFSADWRKLDDEIQQANWSTELS